MNDNFSIVGNTKLIPMFSIPPSVLNVTQEDPCNDRVFPFHLFILLVVFFSFDHSFSNFSFSLEIFITERVKYRCKILKIIAYCEITNDRQINFQERTKLKCKSRSVASSPIYLIMRTFESNSNAISLTSNPSVFDDHSKRILQV